MSKIAITGACGLIGRTLVKVMRDQFDVIEIDLKQGTNGQDLSRLENTDAIVRECIGIIHLAAVSRVAEAQQNPAGCWMNNIVATHNLLWSVARRPGSNRPWIIHASSREVYGNQDDQPVGEDSPMLPVNVYGRSKVACESLVQCAVDAGTNVSILRFANVYGDIHDYSDRVIPAFSRAAVSCSALRVDDVATCMDFTHVSDVTKGIVMVVRQLMAGEKKLPPIHFASGIGTTLGELAGIALAASNNKCELNIGDMRESSVGCFIGDPARAKSLLGWEHKTKLADGFNKMVDDYRESFL